MAGRDQAPLRARNHPTAPPRVMTVAVFGKSPSDTESGNAARTVRVSGPATPPGRSARRALTSSANSISSNPAFPVVPKDSTIASGSRSLMVTRAGLTVKPTAVPWMRNVSSPSAMASSVTSKSTETGRDSSTSVVIGSSATAVLINRA